MAFPYTTTATPMKKDYVDLCARRNYWNSLPDWLRDAGDVARERGMEMPQHLPAVLAELGYQKVLHYDPILQADLDGVVREAVKKESSALLLQRVTTSGRPFDSLALYVRQESGIAAHDLYRQAKDKLLRRKTSLGKK